MSSLTIQVHAVLPHEYLGSSMCFHSFNFSGRSAESSNTAGGIAAAGKLLKAVSCLKRKICQ